MAQRTAKQRRADNARQAKLAELAAAERRKRNRVIGSLGAVGVVVVIVLIMVGVKLATGNGNGKDVSGTASDKVVAQATSVPASTFAKVGAGTVNNPPKAISGGQAPSGTPKVVYVGAEYCPYCAAERWAVVAALSRFGTWSNLGETTSSSHDVFANTPTLSFHGASFSSKYLDFAGYETEDRNQQPLDTLPSADQKILQKYDAPPYVDQSSAGAIPFMYYDGKYISSGASYDPTVLQGLTHAQIAKAMHDPSSPVAKAVDGTANTIAAAVCKLTGGQPGSVCTSPGVKAGAAKL
ncbi:MAG TPA: DUF929 family protein [Marmoricola sp.]|nr:DUF929 family protein [Marmoricola sp.]